MHNASFRRLHPAAVYGLTAVAVAAAALIRWALDPWLGTHIPYATFFLAVALASALGGLRAGLAATALSFLASLFFFVPPRMSFTATAAPDLLGVALFALVALGIAALGKAMWSARSRADHQRRELAFAAIGNARRVREQAALYKFTDTLHRASSLDAVHDAALDAILAALACDRASILLFDDAGVMRFVASRGLSEHYRRAVEGHSPWQPGERDPRPLTIPDILLAALPAPLQDTIARENIRSLAFVPLVADGALIGKFMVYYDAPHQFSAEELDLALTIARQLAFGIEHTRAEAQRAQTEFALRESEQRLRLAMDAGRMGSWEWNLDTNHVVWSPGLEAIHGLAPGSFPGTFEAYQKDIHPDDAQKVRDSIARVLRTGDDHQVEYRIVLPGGAVRWVEGRGKLFRDHAGKPLRMVGVCTDATDRKALEEALRYSERREHQRAAELQSIMEAVPAVIWIARDPDCRVITGNPASFDFLRVPRAGNQSLSAPDTERPSNFQVLVDGRVLQPHELPVQRAARGEEVRDFEEEVRFDDGASRFLFGNATPLRDAAGNPIGAIAAFVDITERKAAEHQLRLHRENLEHLVQTRTAELEASRQQLRVSERMAAIGTLSAGLGHDMGNILMPLRVRLDTLESLGLTPEALEEVNGLRASAEYLRKLAIGLRQLAVDPYASPAGEGTELAAWWAEAEPVLRNTLPRGITLAAHLPDGPCWAAIGRAALTQIAFNLVQNAGDALKTLGAGAVSVAARRHHDRLLLSFADTGPGMSDDVRRRCMEPFFTTKPRGFSTGLGLALVYALAQQAGGSVAVESMPGLGTTFTLSLQLAETPAGAAAIRRAVVDLKDPRLRAYVVAELKNLSYSVVFDHTDHADADLVIVDDAASTPPGPRVVSLSATHSVRDVRQALSQAAAAGPRHDPP